MTESPYPKPYTHVTDVGRFFAYDAEKHEMRFIGDSLEIRVPKRFEVYGLLNIAEAVEAVGVMDLIIDDAYQASLHLLAKIVVEPREIGKLTVKGVEYVVLRLGHGDRFIANTQVVKDAGIVYALWVEFITRGNPIYTMDYRALGTMFNTAKSMCGANLGVDRVVLEVIIAHLARDPDRLFTQYRHTDMRGAYEFIPLRSVSYAPDSTTGRVAGSYFSEGVNSSLVHENHERRPFEDLLRGLPVQATLG